MTPSRKPGASSSAERCMTKLVTVSAVVVGIASFTLGCTDHPPALPSEPAASRPSFGVSTPFNNSGACLFNDAITWNEFVLGMHPTSTPANLNCVANDVSASKLVATEMSVDGGVSWVPVGSNPITCNAGAAITLRLSGTVKSFMNEDRFDVGLWLVTNGGNALTGSCNHYNLPVNPLPEGVTSLDAITDSCGNTSAFSTPAVDLGEVTVVCEAGAWSVEISACVA